MNSDNEIGQMQEAIRTLKEVTKELRDDGERRSEKFFEIFSSMNSNLISINGTLKTVNDNFSSHVTEDKVYHKETNDRIASLEGDRRWVKGAAAGIGLGGGVLGSLIARLFH